MREIFAVELSEEIAPFPPKGNRVRVMPVGGDTLENRLLRIEAHAGSSVIIGGQGHTTASGTSTDELETELLRVFRSFPLRDRLHIMETLYRRETEKAPATEGGGKKRRGLLRCRLIGQRDRLEA